MAAKMIGLILVACMAGALAGPISWEESSATCALQCPENTKFTYSPDTTYEYSYESTMQVSIPGSTEEQSSLHMKATATVEVLSQCEMNLKLLDVSLEDSNPVQYETRQHVEQSWEFKKALQEKPLRFAFVDGHISSICPEEEAVWVLNIKRGILSAFQNTQKDLTASFKTREVDVTGDCPVEYSVSGSGWGVRKITKEKEMVGCRERDGHNSAFQGMPYHIDSSIQSMPLMKSTHKCNQVVSAEGLLVKSDCKELHVFRPFSEGDNGAQALVEYTLSFTKETRGVQTRMEPVHSHSSLLFDHTLTPEEMTVKLEEAQATLEEMCQASQEDIRPNVPKLFAKLIKLMRTLDERRMTSLYRNTRGMCSKAETFFRDAIPNIGTAASLSIISDLIQHGKVTEDEAAVWLTHLTFVPQPSTEMLIKVKPLLTTSGEILRKSSLAISSMLHNYCRLNQGCGQKREVAEIIKVFEDRLSYNCKSSSDEDHRTILMALKALGNTGNAEQAIPALTRCMQNTEEGHELRVAAINAFRRMPCSADRSSLMVILSDKTEDSEIRINTYLMLMHCPNMELVEQMKSLLDNEEINQVSSFIWTHLTNLMESSDPNTQELRDMMQSIKLKAFDMDMRKFSKNLEWSLFSTLLNTGAKIDSNLIYSSESFIPRSGMLNLTVDMFGHSVNLMEVGGRVEGVDSLLENIFNKDNTVKSRRDMMNPRALNQITRSYTPKSNDEPKASYYLKVFGNEIHYNDFHDLDISSLKDKFNFLDWLIRLSQDNQIDYTRSLSFLDSTLTVPTSTGMPLKLSVDGSATLNLKMNGKFDVRQMFSNPTTVDITGSVKPSAALEISSEMSIDAHVAKAGLKMVSTMHTSTITQGKLSLSEDKQFHFDLEMPKDKMEIFSTESKFFMLYRQEEREQRMIRQGREIDSDCYDLTNPLGVELCGKMSMPVWRKKGVTKFPFTGPASMSFFINKKDTFTKYHMVASYTKDRNGPITEAKLYINTPGSKIDREIDINFSMIPSEKKVSLNMKTPWKKADLEGQFLNTAALKKISAKAVIDDQKQYTFISQLDIDSKKFGSKYTPLVELVLPGKPTKTIQGDIFYRDNKKFDFDLMIENVFTDPINMKGNILKVDNARRMKYDTSIDISSSVFKGKFDGFIDKLTTDGESLSSRIVFAYSYKNGKRHKIVLSNKMRNKSTKSLTSISIDSALQTTFWPQYNGEVSLDYTLGRNTISATLDAGFDESRRIKVTNSATFSSKKKQTSVDGMFKLEVPVQDMDYEVSVAHQHDSDSVNSKAKVRYNGKEGNFLLDIKKESTKLLKATGLVELQYPGRKMSLSHTIEEKVPSEYYNDLSVQLDKYTKATANAVYKMKPRHEITATINLPNLNPVVLAGHLKPDLKDMQAHGEVTYGSRKYSASTNWKHNGNFRSFNSEGDMQISYPGRQVEGSGKLTRRDAQWSTEIEFKYDATTDPNKKVTLNAEVTAIASTPAFNIRAGWYPSQFVQMEGNGKYETQGWYATANDLEGTVKFRSSFRNFENIIATFKKDVGYNDLSSTAMVSWAPGKKINSELKAKKNGWGELEMTWIVSTPFNNWRNVELTGKNKVTGNSIESNLSFQWERNQIRAAVTGKVDLRNHQLEGLANFTSPFRHFESLSASGKYSDNGRNYNSNMDVSWAPGRKISTKFTMEHIKNGINMNNNGEMIMQTPFRSLRQYKRSWTWVNDDHSFSFRLDDDYDGKTQTQNLDGSFENTPRKTILSGSYSLDSSYAPQLNGFRAKINHVHNRKGVNSNAMVQWAPNKIIEYEHEVKIDAWESLEIGAKFTSPFKMLNRITLESKTSRRGIQMTTQNEFKWTPNQKISMDGSLSVQGPEITGQMRFTSPFQYIERITMNVNNGKRDGLWQTHADLDFMAERYEIDTKLGWDQTKKILIDTTKMPRYGFLLDTEFTGSPLDFNTEASFSMAEFMSAPLAVVARFDASSLRDIKTRFTLSSPWSEMMYMKGVLSHKQDTHTHYISDISFEIPHYKVSASNDMNLNGWTDFNTRSTIEKGNGKKIELITSLQSNPKISGRVSFTSPYQGAEAINLIVNHEGSYQNFKSGAELSYSPSDKITADVEYTAKGTQVSGTARFTSPFSTIERANVAFNHNGKWKNFENEASVEIGRKRLAGSSKFQLNGYDMKSSASIEIPTRSPITIKAVYNHEGGLDNFKCDSSLDYNGQSGTMDLEFKNIRKMMGKLNLITPFKTMRTLNVDFTHNAKKWNSFENEGSVTWNNKKYSGNSELRWYGTTLKVIANLNIPSEAYSLKVKHKGSWDDFSNSAVVDLNSGQEYSASSTFKKAGETIEGNANIQTPHSSFDKMVVEFSHNGNMRNFRCKGEVITPFRRYKRFAGEIEHNGVPSRFTTTVKVETPFKTLPSTTFNVNHQGDWDSFDSSASAEYNGKTVSGSVNFKNIAKKIEGSASLKTPYSGYDNFEGKFSHTGNRKNFKTNGEVKTPYSGYEQYGFNVEHTGNSWKNFQSKAEVNTPIRHYEKMAFNVKHNGDLSGMTTDASVETSIPGYKNFGFNVNHNGDPQNVRTMVQISTPISGYEKFGLKVNHNGDYRSFQSDASVETPFRGYDMYSVSIKHSGTMNRFNSEVNILTPSGNWGAELNHDGSLQQFTTTAIIRLPKSEWKVNVHHRGHLSDFTSGGSFEYDHYKIEGEGSYQVQKSYSENSYIGSLKMNTPQNQLEITGNHKRATDVKTGKLLVNHNGQKKVDMDYTYSTNAKKNIRITVKQPRLFELVLNGERSGESFSADASFDWERQTKVGVELNLKNQQTSSDTYDRSLSFKMTLPRRDVAFNLGYAKANGKFTNSAEIQWDRDEDSKLKYELELSSSTYRRINYDGSFKLSSALLNFQTTLSHQQVPGRQWNTDISITMDETLRIKHEVTMNGDSITETVTLQHPGFSRDVVLKVDANIQDKLIEGEVDLKFEREAINFKGKVAYESSGSNRKYTAFSQLTYPTLRLDVKFNGEVTDSRYESTANIEFNYLTTRDGVKTMILNANIDKSNMDGNLQVKSPLWNFEVKGSATAQDNYYSTSIVGQCETGQEYKTELTLDMVGRSIDAKFFNPDNNMLHVYARYQRPMAELKVYREVSSREIQDVILNVNLDDQHLITGRAYVRPQIWSDLKAAYSQSDMTSKLSTSLAPVQQAVSEEWRYKYSALRRVAEGPSAAYSKVSNDVERVYTKINRAVYRAYQANEFYLRDVYIALDKQHSKLQKQVSIMKRNMAPHMKRMEKWMQQTSDYMGEMGNTISTKYTEMGQKYRRTYRDMSQKVSNLKDKYMPHVTSAVNSAKSYYQTSKDKVVSTYQKVKNNPTVQKVMKTIRNIKPSDMFGPLRKLKYQATIKWDQMRTKHAEVFDALEDVWDNIARRQEIRDVSGYFTAAALKAADMWEHYEVDKNMRMWLKDLSRASWSQLKADAINGVKDYFQLDKNRFTTYDPLNGNFEFEVYVPYDVQKLQKLPRLNYKYYINRVKKMIDDFSPNTEWSVWDTFYKYKPTMDIKNWIPPFKSHATISGNQHYMTFDKKFYEFAGDCSYLLAHDFINKHFSVMVNYENRGQKKSITMFIGDKQIELMADARLMMDGQPVEMPLDVEDTSIFRLGNMVWIKNKNGVTINCDLPHDRCTVSVSGWYFGKTAGLMGTYDNEPATDLMRSDNTHADSIENMAESWVVGSRCRATNYAQNIPAETYERRYVVCAKYFKESSSLFRPCFMQVDPKPFMTMCLNDLATDSNSVEGDEDVCNTASFYISECKRSAVNIRLPSLCVRCELPSGGSFIEGENVTISNEEVPRSADVVFVIQHGPCNKDVVEKLKDIIDDLDKTFRFKKIDNIKYGIVGFGGTGVMSVPHSHTMEGQIMNSRDKVLLGMETLQFETETETDVMSGVRFAAKYPFRIGVSKSIILLPCEACREGAVRYTELQQLLIERDITLNMIMGHEFTLKGTKSKSPKTAYMFGIDKDGLFTHKHVTDRELSGDAELRNQVALPKDLCAALTQVTDGTVFSANQMTTQNSGMQKKFVDVLVRMWVKKAEPSECQMCDCVADNTGTGMSICHHCDMHSPIYDLLPEFEDESFEESEESMEVAETGGDIDKSKGYVLEFETPKKQPRKYGRNKNRKIRKNRKE